MKRVGVLASLLLAASSSETATASPELVSGVIRRYVERRCGTLDHDWGANAPRSKGLNDIKTRQEFQRDDILFPELTRMWFATLFALQTWRLRRGN